MNECGEAEDQYRFSLRLYDGPSRDAALLHRARRDGGGRLQAGVEQALLPVRGFSDTIYCAPDGYQYPADFAVQPGWEGGELVIPSWSITVPPEDFPAVVEHLRDAEVRRFFDQPGWSWGGYWSFPVLDPAGMTIEVGNTPQERPVSTEWPD